MEDGENPVSEKSSDARGASSGGCVSQQGFKIQRALYRKRLKEQEK